MDNKISYTDAEELRGLLAADGVPVDDMAKERFFAAVILYLFGASFADTSPSAVQDRHVHGVEWWIRRDERIVVSVYLIEHALEHARGEYLAFWPDQQRQVLLIIGYLAKHYTELLDKKRAAELSEAVELLRQRPNGF